MRRRLLALGLVLATVACLVQPASTGTIPMRLFGSELVVNYTGTTSGFWNFNRSGALVLGPGSYAFTFNRGGLGIRIKGVAGGGGGGGGQIEDTPNAGGGGGGAGAADLTGLVVTMDRIDYSAVVGAAGTGGLASNNGTAGGATTFRDGSVGTVRFSLGGGSPGQGGTTGFGGGGGAVTTGSGSASAGGNGGIGETQGVTPASNGISKAAGAAGGGGGGVTIAGTGGNGQGQNGGAQNSNPSNPDATFDADPGQAGNEAPLVTGGGAGGGATLGSHKAGGGGGGGGSPGGGNGGKGGGGMISIERVP